MTCGRRKAGTRDVHVYRHTRHRSKGSYGNESPVRDREH